VDSDDLWSPREGGGTLAAAGKTTCGASELGFPVVSRDLAELVDEEQWLQGGGQSDEAPVPDGAPVHGCAAAPGVDPELMEEFLEGDPWEGCDDVAEWGFVEWCADIARMKSSKVDEDATAALLAMFLADGDTDGDTDGGSTRANTLADVNCCPSMESTGTASLFFPNDKFGPTPRPASGPCSSKSLKGAAGFFLDGDTDGGSTRPSTLAELSSRPSTESSGTASRLFPNDKVGPWPSPASGPGSSQSLSAAGFFANRARQEQDFDTAFLQASLGLDQEPSTAAPSSDCRPYPEPVPEERPITNWVPKEGLGADWEMSFLLRSVADMDD
jgi:hypothetical protein